MVADIRDRSRDQERDDVPDPLRILRTPQPERPDLLGLVLPGGGARAAYQVGLLRCLARHRPDLSLDIITGVSAGAINAAYLAAHPGRISEAAFGLSQLWSRLTTERIFDTRSLSLMHRTARWTLRLTGGGHKPGGHEVHGMVDTRPLHELLTHELNARGPTGELVGIADNLASGRLKACALTTLDYGTGRTVTWVQGKDIRAWKRSVRKSIHAPLTLSHVMASAALPLFFPAVRIGDSWHGDGGVRLAAPLSPALHLGARRIMVISTRYQKTEEELETPTTYGYPPPAQVLGVLYNSVFLDMIDEDILRLQMLNRLLAERPAHERNGMRLVDILVIRPSHDLRRLTNALEPRLPSLLRYMTRGLGTRQAANPAFLSLLLFQRDYLQRLVELGEADAEARAEDIEAFLSRAPGTVVAQERSHSSLRAE